MSQSAECVAVTAQPWLLLSFQLPAKPAYLRVKTWRRLQGLGAVAIKSAVYALPVTEQTQEDFEWLLKEITKGGGEAQIWQACLVGGLSDGEIQDLFRAAREADYDDLAKDVRALLARIDEFLAEQRSELIAQMKRLKARRDGIVAIDYFDGNGRETIEALLANLEQRMSEKDEPAMEHSRSHQPQTITDLRSRTWVTRQGVFVDRIGSAWLIRRFIDPDARFKFVPAQGYIPQPGELRFDMFEAEFTHEGDRCTFEVLLERAGLTEPALQAIAEIVHDIDLKDSKFGREETAGIRTLIAGICACTQSDEERLSRGGAVFEDLYSSFRKAGG